MFRKALPKLTSALGTTTYATTLAYIVVQNIKMAHEESALIKKVKANPDNYVKETTYYYKPLGGSFSFTTYRLREDKDNHKANTPPRNVP